jgi:TetR/AcrR family transcriptional regulator
MGLFSTNLPRREQIVSAALELLATTPLEHLTTRHIAERVGVTQPALFRHFRSREALLLAVVQQARLGLSSQVTQLLSVPAAALDRCDALAALLAQFVDSHPGLPRLLFADIAFDAPELRLAVRQLVGMQQTLVAMLVVDAQKDGLARADIQADAAATLFVAMIQGLALQGLLQGPPQLAPMRERLPPVLRLWHVAVAQNQPVAEKPELPVAMPPPQHARAVLLDVRPILARGVDPLAEIMATLDTLRPSSVLVVTAPFRPKPLEALLTSRGHAVSAHAGPGGLWSLVIVVNAAVPLVDLRDLEAPEPLERLLSLARHLPPNDCVIAHVPRNPRWLLPQLQARGHVFDVLELCDETAIVRVEGAP